MSTRLATTDPLTGLATRGHLLDLITVAFHEDEQLSVLMMDIDHFKVINDRYGHHVGDAALRHVALLSQQSIRRSDAIAGRYGGDDLVVALFDADADTATAIAERINLEVAEHPSWSTDRPSTSPSASARRPSNRRWLTSTSSSRQPDAALYRAKAAGRNTVRHADLTAATAGSSRREQR